MGKKVTLETTKIQKILGIFMLVAAEVFMLYHSAMSVINHFIVYDGVWVTLQSVLLYVALGAGLLWLVYVSFFHPQKRLCRRRILNEMKTREFALLLVMLVLVFVSVIAMCEYHQTDVWWEANKIVLEDQVGQTLILFPLGCWMVRNRKNRWTRLPIEIVVLGTLVLEFFVLVWVFMGQSITLENGGWIGMKSGSLILNCNRNTTGLWGYCVLFLCGYLLAFSGKKMKWVYGLGIFINFMMIALSSSRASLYCVCLAAGLLCALLCLDRKAFPVQKQSLRILLSVLAGIATVLLLYFLRNGLYRLYSLAVSAGTGNGERNLVTLSGRENLWPAALKALVYDTHSSFFGVTPAGVVLIMKELANSLNYTHNQILEVGVGCGIPDMIVFIGLCLVLFLDSIDVCIKKREKPLRDLLPSVGCFMLLAGNMLEATLVGFNYLSGMIFAVACGALAELKRTMD